MYVRFSSASFRCARWRKPAADRAAGSTSLPRRSSRAPLSLSAHSWSGGSAASAAGKYDAALAKFPIKRAEGLDLLQGVEAGALRLDLRAAVAEVLQRAGRRECLQRLEEVLGRVEPPPELGRGRLVQEPASPEVQPFGDGLPGRHEPAHGGCRRPSAARGPARPCPGPRAAPCPASAPAARRARPAPGRPTPSGARRAGSRRGPPAARRPAPRRRSRRTCRRGRPAPRGPSRRGLPARR